MMIVKEKMPCLVAELRARSSYPLSHWERVGVRVLRIANLRGLGYGG
jgi:hypothetical protein